LQNNKTILKGLAICTLILIQSIDGHSQRRNNNTTQEESLTVEVAVVPDDTQLRQAEAHFVEGQKFYILEDYANALRYFRLSAEINPDNAATNYKIAQILSLQGQNAEALLHISKSLSKDTSNKYYYLTAAQIHREMGNLRLATQTLEKMFEAVPDATEYYGNLAEFYLYLNENDKALNALNKAEEYNGIMPEISNEKQRIYILKNNPDQALAEAQKLYEAYPDEASFLLNHTNMLLSLGKAMESRVRLEAYLGDFGEHPEVRLMLAETFRLLGMEEKTKENLVLAFENPDLQIETKIQILMGYLELLPSLDLEPFVAQLASAMVNTHQDHAAAHGVYADFLYQINRPLEALDSYQRSLKLDPSNFQAWQNTMSLQMQMEKWEDLDQTTEDALGYFPNVAAIYFFSGTAKLLKKNYQEAAAVLESGMIYAAGDPPLELALKGYLADALNGTKQYERSDKLYEEVLKADPDNAYALNNYSYYLSLRGQKLEKAKEMSARLIKNNPDNASYLDTHAWVLYKLKDYKGAEEFLLRAIGTPEGASNGTIVEHYGDVLFQLGKKEEALIQWEKARILGDTSEMIDKKIADKKLYE
jgi:tetratricopeptide (TPR) repeat protein